jgi:hypothetical protein
VAAEISGIMDKILSAIRSDQTTRIAFTTVLAIHKPRIFEQGFSAKGAKIGTYVPATAKRKKEQGRNAAFVNLRDTDQMYADYGLVGSNGDYGFGFQNPFNYQKSQWMEQKYQTEIFNLSKYEEDVLADTLVNQLLARI